MKKISTGQLLVLVLLVIVAFQVLYPLGTLLIGSLRDAPLGTPGNFGFQGYVRVLTDPNTYQLLWTSFWLSAVRAVLAVVLALLLAWTITRTNIPFRRFFEWAIMFVFFMPLLPQIIAWIMLLQPRTGFINQFLRVFFPGDVGPLNVYSYAGIVFVGSLHWVPFLFIILAPAFKAMDATLEEQSRMSGASVWSTILHVDAPLMRPALLATSVLAFVKIMESFVVEAMLGLPVNIYVLTTKIYDFIAVEGPSKYPEAMALAMGLLSITIVIVAVQWKLLGQRQYTTVTGRSFKVTRVDLGRAKYLASGAVMVFLFVALFLPLGTLVWSSFMKFAGIFSPDMYTLDHITKAFSFPDTVRSVKNTLIMSGFSATIGMVLCSLIAYAVIKTKHRGKKLLDLISWLPWAIPAMVMALGYLWAYIFLKLPFGITLYGTITLMTLVFVTHGFPLGTRTMTTTMIQLSNELEESSRIHGASWLYTFTHIILPLVAPGFLAGWLLLFTFAVKDLAIVVLLYKPSSTVMSTVIFNWWQLGRFEEAIVLSILQAALIGVAYLVVTLSSRRAISATTA